MLTLETKTDASLGPEFSLHKIRYNGNLVAEFRNYEDAQLAFKVLQEKYNKHWEFDTNSSNWSRYRITQENNTKRSVIYLHKESYTKSDVEKLIKFLNENFQ